MNYISFRGYLIRVIGEMGMDFERIEWIGEGFEEGILVMEIG